MARRTYQVIRAAVDSINAAFPQRESLTHLLSNTSAHDAKTELLTCDSAVSSGGSHDKCKQAQPRTPSRLFKPTPPANHMASAGPNRARRHHVRGSQNRPACNNRSLPRSLASSFPRDEPHQASATRAGSSPRDAVTRAEHMPQEAVDAALHPAESWSAQLPLDMQDLMPQEHLEYMHLAPMPVS